GLFSDSVIEASGFAVLANILSMANLDALGRLAYQDGMMDANRRPLALVELRIATNTHWTKPMTSIDYWCYLDSLSGSNANITERGMVAEVNRAMVWQIVAQTGAYKPYATGLRNPTARAIQPGTDVLWAVVNERDELGPNLVPDYLTSVQEGGFYGWPWAYWGNNVDPRVRPENPEKVAQSITPDYSLGSHVAALGLDFSSEVMGPDFADGVFVGEHGS